jgi:hypothetical protein
MVTGLRRGSHPREVGPCSIVSPVKADDSTDFVESFASGAVVHPVKNAKNADIIATLG